VKLYVLAENQQKFNDVKYCSGGL